MLSRLIRAFVGLALVVTMSLAEVFTYNTVMQLEASGRQTTSQTSVVADITDQTIRFTYFNDNNDESITYALFRDWNRSGDPTYSTPDGRVIAVHSTLNNGERFLMLINTETRTSLSFISN